MHKYCDLSSHEDENIQILLGIEVVMDKQTDLALHEDDNIERLPGIQDIPNVNAPINIKRFYLNEQSSGDTRSKFYKPLEININPPSLPNNNANYKNMNLKPTQFTSTQQQPFIEANESYNDIANEFTDSASHTQYNASQPHLFAFKSNAPTQKQISFIYQYKFKQSEIQHPLYDPRY
eukprot:288297_1